MAHINSRIRLVRLRPQFADLYPGLYPGVWETATELAARLLAQHVVQPSPGFTNRILPDMSTSSFRGELLDGNRGP
jgi:hypothetical protein